MLMKKLLGIVVLGLLLNGNAYAKIIESSDKHIWLYLPKGISKTEAFSDKRIQYAKDHGIKYKKNTYSFSIGKNHDYDRVLFGRFQFRFICAKNMYEAIENYKYVLRNFQKLSVYDVKIKGKEPLIEHIVLSHIEFPDPNEKKIYEAKIKKEEEQKQRAEAKASGDLTFTIKDKKEQCTAIGYAPATEKFADCVLRLVELDVKSQQTAQIALAQSQGNQQVAEQLKKQNNSRSSDAFIDLGLKLLSPQSTVSAPSTSTCRVIGSGAYKTVNCW